MSLNSRQAGRDAESFDDDRHDGVYSPGGRRAHYFPVEPRSVEPLAPDMQAALDLAMAQIERAFGSSAARIPTAQAAKPVLASAQTQARAA